MACQARGKREHFFTTFDRRAQRKAPGIYMHPFKRTVGFAALLAVIGLGAAGCQSFGDASPGSLTSVQIVNRPMASVRTAVTNVFTAHAFLGGATGTNQFTYSRPGTSLDKLAYGSSLFDQPITVRVVVTARQQTPELIVVGCNAWIVEAENDPVFRELHPVRSFGKGPYEDLLKEVRAQAGP